MADADFDGFGDGVSSTGFDGARLQRIINIAGGLSSLALVLGLGFWGYKLAVRDVRGVPVVQALDGPMRMSPENPGGTVADHQGLSVNEVAAEGTAAPPPERLILAPRPVELLLEDAAGLAGQPVPGSLPVSAAGASPDVTLAAEPLMESADPIEIAVAAALAEALAEAAPGEDGLGIETFDTVLAEPAPVGALSRSPRPMSRPTAAAAPALTAVQPAAVAPVREVDPSTLTVGTRLVQFGAFDTVDAAKGEWAKLANRFGDLMAGKDMVVQAAESGGRTFFRLRAHGFENEDDARRFCSAFVAEDAACIPVAHR